MEDLFKKLLYTGVGMVATTTEKVQSTVRELVEKGNLPAEDGKKIIDDFIKSTENKTSEFEQKARVFIESIIERVDINNKEEINVLKDKINQLEEELNQFISSKKK